MPSIFDEIDAIEAQQTPTASRKPSVFDEIDAIEAKQNQPAQDPSKFKGIDVGLLAAAGPMAVPLAIGSAVTSPEYLRSVARGASAEGIMAVGEGSARLGAAAANEVAGLLPGSDRAKLEGRLQELTQLEQQLSPSLPQGNDPMSFAEVLLPEEQARLDQVRAERQHVLDQIAQGAQQGVLGEAANAISRGRQAVREALPVSQDVQQSIPGQVAQTLGQAASTLPFYVIPGVGEVIGPATAVAQIYQEGYDDAINHGADPITAHETAMTYLPAAGLDVIGDKLVVGRFLKPLVGKPIKAVIDVALRAASEGATETGQQAFLNYIAKELTKYDPERPLTSELKDTLIVSTIVGGITSGGIQVAGEREQVAQVADAASQAVDQASQQVVQSQQAIQTAQAGNAATITSALEDPEAETLDDMEAKQKALADNSKQSQQVTQQASQSLQQAGATLQQATTVEAQANQQLDQLDAVAEQILSQPGILPGGNQTTQPQATQQAQTDQFVGEPVLPEAQPAQVGPVSLAAVAAPIGELQNAGQIGTITQAAGPQEGLVGGEGGRVRLRDAQENGVGAINPEAQVLNAGQATPQIQPVEVAQAGLSLPEATLTPVEPQMAPESIPAQPMGLPVTQPEAAPTPTVASRGLIVGSKTEAWADKAIAESQGRVFSGLDPKLSFAYAVKGAALIEQGIRDFTAWSVEMGKRYAGLTAENLKELFARATEMSAAIRAGDQVVIPPEVRGALVSTEDDAAIEAEAARQNNLPPLTPDPESIETAEDKAAAEADPIVTRVLGQEFTVDGRRQWNPGEMQRSRNHARGVFEEAGLPVRWDSNRGIYVLVDPTSNQEAAGRKLVEIMKRELGKPRQEGDALATVLVNSIRSQDGGMWVSDAFSLQTRNDMFSIAQGEASFYGLLLGSLASAKRTLSWVATHVDTVLHKAYSDAFGGNQVGSILTKVADEIQKETGIDPRDAKAVAKEKDKVAKAKKRALDAIRKVLTPRERVTVDKPIRGKKSLWVRIEEAVDAGMFDNATIMQDIARANGWEVPTPVQLQRLKDMAERERSLRDTPERAAATKEERYRLMREMQTLWSRFARPISWRTPEGRRNFGAAGAEYLSANMLLKLGFWVKQPIDVMSQVFWHVPTRALASAAQIARSDKAQGKPTRYWEDAGAALRDASVNLITNARQAVTQFTQGIRGRGELRNVEGIVGTINAFDRMRQMADEYAAQGDHTKATVVRMLSWIQFSFKLARALDNAQGTFVVGQEMRERIIEELRSAGRDPTQARSEAATILGDQTAEIALAMGRAKEILDEEGIPHNATQLSAAAYELFRARQFERIKSAGLNADMIAQSNERLRQTVGWNMPERRGLGGAIGGAIRNIGRSLEEVGIPLPIGRFGNAIAIGINRALTWTPVGFFPSAFGGSENAWFRTEKDRIQRKIEAGTGTALGGMLIGAAVAGLLRVWNKGPDDPEDRELWEKAGHRAGTVEFYYAPNKFIAVSTSTGPLSYMRGALGGIGVMQDVLDGNEKRARRFAKEAEKRGLKGPTQEPVSVDDLGGALAYGAYQAILGGRTAGGAIRSTVGADRPESITDFLKTFTASQTSPFVPLLPAFQEVQRARGVRLNYGQSGFTDLLVPTFESHGARRNFLNDPLIPSLEQSVVQTLSGGTYGPVSTEEGKFTKPYRIFNRIDYRPDSISRSQGFTIGDEFRPLNDAEWKKVMQVRGDLLKAELQNVSEFQPDEDLESEVKLIAPLVRREALDAVGAR